MLRINVSPTLACQYANIVARQGTTAIELCEQLLLIGVAVDRQKRRPFPIEVEHARLLLHREDDRLHGHRPIAGTIEAIVRRPETNWSSMASVALLLLGTVTRNFCFADFIFLHQMTGLFEYLLLCRLWIFCHKIFPFAVPAL